MKPAKLNDDMYDTIPNEMTSIEECTRIIQGAPKNYAAIDDGIERNENVPPKYVYVLVLCGVRSWHQWWFIFYGYLAKINTSFKALLMQ